MNSKDVENNSRNFNPLSYQHTKIKIKLNVGQHITTKFMENFSKF